MNKSFAALFLVMLATAWLVPQAAAQRGGNEGDGPGARNQVRQQRPQRRGDRRMRRDDAPKIGDVAPTFKLKSLDGQSITDLADFQGVKPVVLLFGSYT